MEKEIDYLNKIRYLYILRLKTLGINEVNNDIDFKNNYFNDKKRWL